MQIFPGKLVFRRAMWVMVCALGVANAYVWAQLPQGTSSGGQVNPQMNTALYGGGVPASVRYANVGASGRALDSEVRHAYWAAGMTPSEYRMNAAAIGPLTPTGSMAYIRPTAQPAYLPQASKAPPPPMGAAAYSTASIRYSTPSAAPVSTYVAPMAMPTGRVSPSLVSAGPINAGPINTGTVRFSR